MQRKEGKKGKKKKTEKRLRYPVKSFTIRSDSRRRNVGATYFPARTIKPESEGSRPSNSDCALLIPCQLRTIKRSLYARRSRGARILRTIRNVPRIFSRRGACRAENSSLSRSFSAAPFARNSIAFHPIQRHLSPPDSSISDTRIVPSLERSHVSRQIANCLLYIHGLMHHQRATTLIVGLSLRFRTGELAISNDHFQSRENPAELIQARQFAEHRIILHEISSIVRPG